MFLYFFSSYCVNFGPNVTTYVMAAETYPTELRGTLHGSEVYYSLNLSCTIFHYNSCLTFHFLIVCSICLPWQMWCLVCHDCLQIP